MKRKIEQFLRRDINSTVAPGKRDTITRRGLKKQKRYLNDSLKTLHEIFVKENTDNKVSYPTFCKFRPFYIVEMKAGDRNTCLCKLHENMRFKVEKLHQLKLIETKNPETVSECVVCDMKHKPCANGNCSRCKSKEIPLTTHEIREPGNQATVNRTEEIEKDSKGIKDNKRRTTAHCGSVNN
jgi:hypothetical protein